MFFLNPNKINGHFRFSAAILIGGVLLFILWASYHRRWDKARRFEQWFSVSLPTGAEFLHNEEPNPFNLFKSQIYSYFWLPPEAMARFITKSPEGYSQYQSQFETFDSVHFFTSCQWPHAFFCNRSGPKTKRVFIVDPPSGMVYGMAWSD